VLTTARADAGPLGLKFQQLTPGIMGPGAPMSIKAVTPGSMAACAQTRARRPLLQAADPRG
jgi:hypothetical protein